MKKRRIIKELQSDPRLMAECCQCGRSFSLKKALVFHVEDPITPSVIKWRDAMFEDLKQKEQALKNNKRQVKELIPKTIETVGRGKILEKIVPAYSEMKYRLSDYTAIFEPIDYILFDGVSRNGHIESVKFIDCKSGTAGLNRHQKEIKTAIEQERLSFETYKGIRQ